MADYYVSHNDYFGFCVVEEDKGNGRIVFTGTIEEVNRKCIELNEQEKSLLKIEDDKDEDELSKRKIQEIGFYESFNFNVPDYYRVTEYSHELAEYKIKSSVTEEEVREAYKKAVAYRTNFEQAYFDKWEKEHKEKLPDEIKENIHNLIKDKMYYHNMEEIIYRTLGEYEYSQNKGRSDSADFYLNLDSIVNEMPIRRGVRR